MTIKHSTLSILAAVLLATGSVSALAAADQCRDIGGMGLAEAVDEINLVAALSGDMTGARARITAQQETSSGLVFDMEHYFINDNNGLLKTRDKATLTAVPDKDQTYMLEVAYKVVESRGSYAGYKGTFNSFGLIKLGEGKLVLRYLGELCK